MGYFPNGTSGDIYIEEYCAKCVNSKNDAYCSVWQLHLMYSYQLCNEKHSPAKIMLDTLIPVDAEGFNTRCTMFHPRSENDMAANVHGHDWLISAVCMVRVDGPRPKTSIEWLESVADSIEGSGILSASYDIPLTPIGTDTVQGIDVRLFRTREHVRAMDIGYADMGEGLTFWQATKPPNKMKGEGGPIAMKRGDEIVAVVMPVRIGKP